MKRFITSEKFVRAVGFFASTALISKSVEFHQNKIARETYYEIERAKEDEEERLRNMDPKEYRDYIDACRRNGKSIVP